MRKGLLFLGVVLLLSSCNVKESEEYLLLQEEMKVQEERFLELQKVVDEQKEKETKLKEEQITINDQLFKLNQMVEAYASKVEGDLISDNLYVNYDYSFMMQLPIDWIFEDIDYVDEELVFNKLSSMKPLEEVDEMDNGIIWIQGLYYEGLVGMSKDFVGQYVQDQFRRLQLVEGKVENKYYEINGVEFIRIEGNKVVDGVMMRQLCCSVVVDDLIVFVIASGARDNEDLMETIDKAVDSFEFLEVTEDEL